MMSLLDKFASEQLREGIPDFRPGDTVKVHVRIVEGEKRRIQIFQGVVIRKRGRARGATFTVRKISYGVGVERIFPLHSPSIDHIEIVQLGRVRRARLYYLRKLRGKKARIRVRRVSVPAPDQSVADDKGRKAAAESVEADEGAPEDSKES